MAIPFLNHLDLLDVSELQNAILHKTTAASASSAEGKLIYDTGSDTVKYYNGSSWIELDGQGYTHPAFTARTIDLDATGASVISTIDFTSNNEGHVTTASATTRTLTLSDLGYTGATDADNYGYWTLSDGTNSTNISSTGTATFQGTPKEVTVAESGGTVTIGLPDDVTIASQLVVGSTAETAEPVIHSKTGGTGDNILLESTNTGAGSAPDLTLYRNAGVPADSDTLGVVAFRGRNYPNTGTNTYNGIYSRIIDASQQHSALTFSAYYGSSTAHVMGIHNTADNSSSGKVVINPATFSSVPTHTLDVNGDADISSNLGVGGNLTVAGNLTVEGSTTTVESTTVTMTDNILQLNVAAAGDTQVDPTSYSGIEVVRGSNDNRQLVWNETTDKWQIETSTNTYENIATTGDLPTVNDGTLTVQGNNGLTGSGTFTANDSDSPTITLSHADTSSQSSVNNSGVNVIQDVTLDAYGHVTGLASVDLSSGIDTRITNREYKANFPSTGTSAGDTITITHNLATRDVIVQFYALVADIDGDANTPNVTQYEEVKLANTRATTNTITVQPNTALAANALRVLIKEL